MSDKQKYPRVDALALAQQIVKQLQPFTDRIQIAGSIRRNKPEVSDIEILFIPKFEERAVDMFSTTPMDVAEEKINAMLAVGDISKRPSVAGTFTWGPKNKLALHKTGIPVDFFATTAENWWVSLVVRTGSKETNLRLTNGAIQRGRSLRAYGCGVRLANGEITKATSEEEVFKLCGVPYLEPEKR